MVCPQFFQKGKNFMKKQMRNDFISAGIAIAFGIFVYIMSGSIVVKRKGGDIGSTFLPQLIAGIMIGLGILLFISTFLKLRRETSQAPKEEKDGGKEWIPTLLSFANIIVYVLIFKPVGFIISTFIFLVAQMWIMSPVRKPSLKQAGIWVLIAVITTLAIYFLFTKAFSMPLPKGILSL